MTTEEKDVEYICTVKDVQGRLAEGDTFGSRFGLCSCGVMQTDAVPCIHMAAVVKSSKVPGLNMGNIMPY